MSPLESQIEVLPVSLIDPVPAPVQHLDAAALEWHPLLALVAGYAVSRVGHEAIETLTSSSRPSVVPASRAAAAACWARQTSSVIPAIESRKAATWGSTPAGVASGPNSIA